MMLLCALTVFQFDSSGYAFEQATRQENAPSRPTAGSGVTINDRVQPPKTYPRARYQFVFAAAGNSVPPLHWRVVKGALPPGLILEDEGVLHGRPERAGEYRFTLSVSDAAKPPHSAQKDFEIEVEEAFTVTWKTPAHVIGS